MKRLFCLFLTVLLLTGCAAPVTPPDDALPESVPEAAAPAAPESSPTTAEPTEPTPITLPEDLDTLLRLPAYYWYGHTVKTDDPVNDFGSFAMDTVQKKELYALLQPESWTIAADVAAVGITPALCARGRNHALTLCQWDNSALILLHSETGGVRQSEMYFAPAEVYHAAYSFMYKLAYATLPNPQQLKDLSPLCAYPNSLSAEFAAQLTGMEIGAAKTIGTDSIHWEDHLSLLNPYFYTSLLPMAWEDANDIPADRLMWFFRVAHFNRYSPEENFLIDALILEPILQQYYDVSVQHLRTAENFIRDAGCYRFSGIDGLGGGYPSPTLLQRTGENSWRLFTVFDASFDDTPQLQYNAFDFELTDTGFRYLRGLGEVAAETVPLPMV